MPWVRILVNVTACLVVASGVYFAANGEWWHFVGLLFLASLVYLPHWLYDGVAGFAGTFKPRFRETMEVLLATFVLINAAGYVGLFNVYFFGMGYDTLVHFFGKLLIIFMAIIAYTAYRWHTKREKPQLKTMLWLAVIGGFGIGIAWELVESGVDVLIEAIFPGRNIALRLSGQLGEPQDTLYDMLANIAAVVIAALMILRYYPALQHWRRWRDFVRDVRPRRRSRQSVPLASRHN